MNSTNGPAALGAAATPAAAKAAYDEAHKISSQATWDFFGSNCRNCFMGGKGVVGHPLKKCHELNNKCYLTCAKCKEGVHWIEDCKG